MTDPGSRAGTGRPPSVLLVHANPFQRALPVPPYGLERVRTAAEAAGAEVTIIDPFLFSESPLEDAADAARRLAPDVIGIGVRVVDDCITISHPDAGGDEAIDVSWFMPEVRALCDRLRAAAPEAFLVAGGAAFSFLPEECLDYLDIEYGVVGPGEATFAELVRRWRGGLGFEGTAGLVRRGETSALEKVTLAGLDEPTRREPVYTGAASFPMRTRTGCAMQCNYCLTANMLRRHANRSLESALDEIESIVKDASGRAVGRVPIFFADDEFNLPDEGHAIALLRGLVERGLVSRIRWRGYFNPTPFSAELADLIRRTNGQVSLSVDTASETVMKRTQKPFRLHHLDEALGLLAERKIKTDLALIFGLPGETQATIAETIAFVRRLPESVRVVYSAGARVYPHTPLADAAAAEPEHLYGDRDPSFLAPVVFSAPLPPRPLARQLAAELADLPNVAPVTLAYKGAGDTLARAYRIVTSRDGAEPWIELLEDASLPDPAFGTPQNAFLSLAHVAEWHERFDLALLACRRLASLGDLPPGFGRWQLRILRSYFWWRQLKARRTAPPVLQAGTS